MATKRKGYYPGGIKKTQKLRYYQRNNYLEFIKMYQELLKEKQQAVMDT